MQHPLHLLSSPQVGNPFDTLRSLRSSNLATGTVKAHGDSVERPDFGYAAIDDQVRQKHPHANLGGLTSARRLDCSATRVLRYFCISLVVFNKNMIVLCR